MNIKIERFWPFVLSSAVLVLMIVFRINFVDGSELGTALDGIITIAALIVGFFGAILPVIIGMKNGSKFARYVFERDKHKLFLKYIRATLLCGVILIGVSVLLYFKNDFTIKHADDALFYIESWLFISFLACTYRSVNHMLRLVFATDAELMDTNKHDLLKRSSSQSAENMRNALLKEQEKTDGQHTKVDKRV